MERAKSLDTPAVSIQFNADIPYTSGYMQVLSVTFKHGKSFAGFSLLTAICDDDGEILPSKIAEKLLLSDGVILGEAVILTNILTEELKKQEDKLLADFEAHNRRLYEEERRKLEAYSSDKQVDYELELKRTAELIEKLDKQIDGGAMSFKARLALIDERDEAADTLANLRLSLFENEDEEKKKLVAAVEALAKKLKFKHNVENIFLIRWTTEWKKSNA